MKLTIIYSSFSDYTSTLSGSFIVRLFLVMQRFQATAEITLFFYDGALCCWLCDPGSKRHVGWLSCLCGYLLTSAKHCFGNMAENKLSFGVVSRRIMMTGIESMTLYIFSGVKLISKKDLYFGNTGRNHWNQRKRYLKVELSQRWRILAK